MIFSANFGHKIKKTGFKIKIMLEFLSILEEKDLLKR